MTTNHATGVSGESPETPPTLRSRAKADRRRALLSAAASLFAERGYHRVSIEELGAAAGVSGPAVYRHFSSKQAVLAAMLTDVSDELLLGGRTVVQSAGGPAGALRSLVQFHVDFALSNPDVIRVQDRDLFNLAAEDQSRVRSLQRSYVQLWVEMLRGVQPDVDGPTLRLKVQATFGLINSTPHSVRSHGRPRELRTARPVLEAMALAGLLA